MGHYASEMDPEWGESVSRSDRLSRLRNKLAEVPLSKFTAEDAYDLARLFSVVDFTKISDARIKKFEKIAGIR